MRSVLYGLQLVSAFDDLVIGRSGPTSEVREEFIAGSYLVKKYKTIMLNLMMIE